MMNGMMEGVGGGGMGLFGLLVVIQPALGPASGYPINREEEAK